MDPDSLRGEHLLRPVHAAKPLAPTPRGSWPVVAAGAVCWATAV
jgi:hypothetical protein